MYETVVLELFYVKLVLYRTYCKVLMFNNCTAQYVDPAPRLDSTRIESKRVESNRIESVNEIIFFFAKNT